MHRGAVEHFAARLELWLSSAGGAEKSIAGAGAKEITASGVQRSVVP
jgi:hypothetical protein